MKVDRRFLKSSLMVATFVSYQAVQAQALPVPRGAEIERLAANCGIGPFPQTTKAGKYNQFCEQLTDSEKCLALIKSHFDALGVLHPAKLETPRVQYCMQNFMQQLLGQSGQSGQ